MRTGVLPLTAWGAALVAIAVAGAAAAGLDLLPTLLLAGAGGAAVTTGLAALWLARGPRPDAELVLQGSAATGVLVAGTTVALIGAVAGGPAFLYPGAGLAALGAGGIVREVIAGRRLLDRGPR